MYGATASPTRRYESLDEKGSLQSIESDLETLRGYLDQLGSSSDGAGLRESIRSLRCMLKKKISDEQVRQSNLLDQLSGDKCELLEDQKRDSQQLQTLVGQLYHMMEEESSCLQRYPSPNRPTGEREEADWGGTTAIPLLQSLPLDSAAQAEGDAAALEEIQRDITDLQEIQNNLNRLVHGQGKDIDVIEANVGVAQARVLRGRRVLGEAAALQGSSRRKKCCIAVCVLVAAAVPVIILAILIPTLLLIINTSR